MLAIGPRGPADQIAVDWDDVLAAEQTGSAAGGPVPLLGTARSKPMGLASQPGPTLARAGARQRQVQSEQLKAQQRRNDVLSLLALGYGFQVRLIGQVAAAHAARGGGEQVGSGPALVAAITGRLAPVAEEWLGIDPDQVVVDLHAGAQLGIQRADRVRRGPPAAGQPARRVAGAGLGLRAGPGRAAPDRRGAGAGLADGPGARAPCAGRETRAAERPRRPGWSRGCPTLGSL